MSELSCDLLQISLLHRTLPSPQSYTISNTSLQSIHDLQVPVAHISRTTTSTTYVDRDKLSDIFIFGKRILRFHVLYVVLHQLLSTMQLHSRKVLARGKPSCTCTRIRESICMDCIRRRSRTMVRKLTTTSIRNFRTRYGHPLG